MSEQPEKPKQSLRVLLIEDNPGDALLIKEYLAGYKGIPFTVEWKETLTAGLSALAANKYDAIILDLGLPDSPQISATFTRTQSAAPTVPIVVITGLDDETFAATTVRRGAQDYLVKGKIDTDTLARTIHYAIARKLGVTRSITMDQLRQFDGGGGRPAYLAFKDRVYEVSNSQLWKGGKHAAVHLAGNDLTEAIARAPHGEEVLTRVSVIGDLVKQEKLRLLFAQRFENLHVHTTAAHFSVTYAPLATIFFILWFLNGQRAFEEVAFYLLIVGLVSALVSGTTGILSWMISYESKTSGTSNLKIALSILLLSVAAGTLIWRVTGYARILLLPGSLLYLMSFAIQTAICLALDYLGKKIVYA